MYYVYILYSPSHDRYYVGQTSDLSHRLSRHNAGLVTSTKGYVPWELVYYESYSSRSESMSRERKIKRRKSRSYIESLIAGKDSGERSE